MNDLAVDVRGLNKSFGPVHVLHDCEAGGAKRIGEQKRPGVGPVRRECAVPETRGDDREGMRCRPPHGSP